MTEPSKPYTWRDVVVLAGWNLFIKLPLPMRRLVDKLLRADYGA